MLTISMNEEGRSEPEDDKNHVCEYARDVLTLGLLLGLRRLGEHEFEHNQLVRASIIMPA